MEMSEHDKSANEEGKPRQAIRVAKPTVIKLTIKEGAKNESAERAAGQNSTPAQMTRSSPPRAEADNRENTENATRDAGSTAWSRSEPAGTGEIVLLPTTMPSPFEVTFPAPRTSDRKEGAHQIAQRVGVADEENAEQSVLGIKRKKDNQEEDTVEPKKMKLNPDSSRGLVHHDPQAPPRKLHEYQNMVRTAAKTPSKPTVDEKGQRTGDHEATSKNAEQRKPTLKEAESHTVLKHNSEIAEGQTDADGASNQREKPKEKQVGQQNFPDTYSGDKGAKASNGTMAFSSAPRNLEKQKSGVPLNTYSFERPQASSAVLPQPPESDKLKLEEKRKVAAVAAAKKISSSKGRDGGHRRASHQRSRSPKGAFNDDADTANRSEGVPLASPVVAPSNSNIYLAPRNPHDPNHSDKVGSNLKASEYEASSSESTENSDGGRKSRMRPTRTEFKWCQYDEDRLLIYAINEAEGSLQKARAFLKMVTNYRDRTEKELEKRFHDMSEESVRPGGGWTRAERLLLLRIVFDALMLQQEVVESDDEQAFLDMLHLPTSKDMRSYLEDVADKMLKRQENSQLSRLEIMREHMGSCLKDVLEPRPEVNKERPRELLYSIHLSGKEGLEERWDSSIVYISEERLKQQLRQLNTKLLDWARVQKMWRMTDACQPRTLSALRDMLYKLRKNAV